MLTEEFNSIYKRHWWTVFNFAKKELKELEDWHYVEEVTSEVFINLWKSQPEFEDEKKIRAWLYVATKRQVIDLMRIYNHHYMEPLDYSYYELTYEDEEEMVRLEIASEVFSQVIEIIKRYTEREKQIFNLHFLHELPVGKVAEILKTKPQTISNQLLTLKKRLRQDTPNPFKCILFL